MTKRSLITRRTYIPSQCALNLGGGSYKLELSCGHVEYRRASRAPLGNRVKCHACAVDAKFKEMSP